LPPECFALDGLLSSPSLLFLDRSRLCFLNAETLTAINPVPGNVHISFRENVDSPSNVSEESHPPSTTTVNTRECSKL
jgi:hypothetical protein